jgi:hypothetical protein
MQDFLAGGGHREGDYTELQVGPAPTQMQNFPVPKQSNLQWTEWFKGFKADQKAIRSDDYQLALNEIDSWMKSDSGMKQETVKSLDSFFEKYATVDPDKMLVEGQPWGALEEMLLGKRLVSGLKFNLPKDKNSLAYKEAQPWYELLKHGAFSEETLNRMPISYQTTDRWFAVLEKSVQKQGMTYFLSLSLSLSLSC